MPVSLRRALPLLTAGLLAGCAPGGDGPGLVLGTGEAEFEAITDGDVLQVIRGPQGGYHMLGSLLVKGVEAGDPDDLASNRNPTMSFDVEHNGDSVILLDAFTQGLDEAPSREAPYTHQLVGRFVVLDRTDSQLDGETVTFSARIDDVNGLSAEASLEVELEPHPFN